MLKALTRKELRELLPLVAIALLLQMYLVCVAAGIPLGFLQRSNNTIPFLMDSFSYYLLVVAGLTAAAIGFWQTWWESSRGTFLFLLHRPAERRAIIGAKLCVGLILYFAIALVPLLAYSLWAATPGTHASPFFWSMTTSEWLICLQLPLVYFAAFLSGLRPGRFFGSRLLPLAASGLVIVAVSATTLKHPVLGLALVVATDLCFLLAIFDVAHERDYS